MLVIPPDTPPAPCATSGCPNVSSYRLISDLSASDYCRACAFKVAGVLSLTAGVPGGAPAVPARYGAAKIATIRRDFDRLRSAIQRHDPEATEAAWLDCERWLEAVMGAAWCTPTPEDAAP